MFKQVAVKKWPFWVDAVKKDSKQAVISAGDHYLSVTIYGMFRNFTINIYFICELEHSLTPRVSEKTAFFRRFCLRGAQTRFLVMLKRHVAVRNNPFNF